MQKNFLTEPTREYSPHDAKNLDRSSRFKEIGEHTFKKKGKYMKIEMLSQVNIKI